MIVDALIYAPSYYLVRLPLNSPSVDLLLTPATRYFEDVFDLQLFHDYVLVGRKKQPTRYVYALIFLAISFPSQLLTSKGYHVAK